MWSVFAYIVFSKNQNDMIYKLLYIGNMKIHKIFSYKFLYIGNIKFSVKLFESIQNEGLVTSKSK